MQKSQAAAGDACGSYIFSPRQARVAQRRWASNSQQHLTNRVTQLSGDRSAALLL